MCAQACLDIVAQIATVYVFYCFISYVSISTEKRCLEFCQGGSMGKIIRSPCIEMSAVCILQRG